MKANDELHPTGDQLSNAIWEAAWFAVNKTDCSKAEFVAMVTLAANEAFDSQMHNAAVRSARAPTIIWSTNNEPPTLKTTHLESKKIP